MRLYRTRGLSAAQEVDVAPGVNLESVAGQLEGYSGDDITNICRDAAMNGMRRMVAGKTPMEIKALREAGKDSFKVGDTFARAS